MDVRKLVLLMVAGMAVITSVAAGATELTVYSARKEHLIKPVFDAYTSETGVRIRYLTDKAPSLLQRLKAEGKRSPADILITVDAGNLWHAAREGVLQSVRSPLLEENVPAHLRDPEGYWYGLSIRARTIVYNTNRVKPEELSTYGALAGPAWKDRLVLRTSKKVYNQSLVAMLIAEKGYDETKRIVSGWVANLAAAPFSNDTKVLEAVAAGVGEVGIVNTYYYGRLMREKPDLPLALFWPDQQGSGVHVNVSGAGVAAHAPNRDEAVRFLEWLSSPAAQKIFADANMEYPVNQAVQPHPTVASWGTFKQNMINLANAGARQAEAVRLMDEAGYR
ncbi:MAG: extracellular solute-binding protein [Desulfobulbaceae bacterium]